MRQSKARRSYLDPAEKRAALRLRLVINAPVDHVEVLDIAFREIAFKLRAPFVVAGEVGFHQFALVLDVDVLGRNYLTDQ